MPFLRQEFILREEKIKINEENKMKILMNKNKTISLLEPNKVKQDNIDISLANISNINENKDKIDLEEQNKNSKIFRNKEEQTLKIKTRCKNLFQHINNIKNFLRKNGYIKFGGNIKKFELEVTDGEIDIFLYLEKYKTGYIKLNYYKVHGSFESFERFKSIIVNIRSVISM